jgi:hypothetical protein
MSSVFPARERTSCTYEADLVDDSNPPVPVPAGSLLTLKLTLWDRKTGTIINGRNEQNVLQAAGVTVNAEGHLIWVLSPEDNAHIAGDGTVETHVALWEWTYGSPVRTGNHEMFIQLQGVTHVP